MQKIEKNGSNKGKRSGRVSHCNLLCGIVVFPVKQLKIGNIVGACPIDSTTLRNQLPPPEKYFIRPW